MIVPGDFVKIKKEVALAQEKFGEDHKRAFSEKHIGLFFGVSEDGYAQIAWLNKECHLGTHFTLDSLEKTELVNIFMIDWKKHAEWISYIFNTLQISNRIIGEYNSSIK